MSFFRTLLAAAFCLTLISTPLAQASTLAQLPAPSASFDSGMLHIDRYGNGPRALVFIPGLGCGPWSWAGEISHFSKSYSVYAITLAGFDGRPFAPQSNLFAAFDHDFWAFVDAQHLVKPVVVGHSLGGTLGFALAESHPERLGGVVALDGLPIFPMLAQATDAQRAATASQMSTAVASETHDQLLAYELGFMKQATTQSDLVDPTAQLEAKSDPKAIAAWLQADLTNDLRPALPKATVRIVELMPYAQPSQYSKDQTLAFYQMLVHGAPNVTVVPIDGARHFAMLDQPAAVDTAITQFLASK